MAWVIGPNDAVTYVPDQVATSLVGDGNRGYAYASEPKVAEPEAPEPNPTPAPRKRAPRKPKPTE